MKTKHGMCGTRIYNIWLNMRQRCTNEKRKDYSYYKDKGMSSEWNDFSTFYKWSIDNGYNDNLELDRIDNNIGYFPSNCRYATRKEQMNNTSRNNYYEAFGDKGTIRFFCDKYNISYNTLRTRLYTMSMEEAISKGKQSNSFKVEKYTYKGFIGSRKQICDKFGYNYYTIKSRMNICGKTFYEALED